jgi:hypothetical protein
MTNTVACAYSLTAVGSLSATALQTGLVAVPVDMTLPNLYGMLYISDTSGISGQVVTRTMTFRTTPTSDASASTSLVPGDAVGGPLDGVSLIGAGSKYAAPPLVTFAGGTPDRPALAHAVMGVDPTGIIVIKAGSGYVAPTAAFQGPAGSLVPGGTPATATVTTDGSGHITGLIVTSVGGPYLVPPTVVISDVSGSGAIVVAPLSVTGIVIDDPGNGFVVAPTPVFTPVFKQFFPDPPVGNGQALSLGGFMQGVFQLALGTPVIAAVPVVS